MIDPGLNADLDVLARTTKSNLKKKPPRPTSSDSDKRVTFPTTGSATLMAGIKEEEAETQMATTAETIVGKKARAGSAKTSTKKGVKQSAVKR
jgi:hypothetical protein